ncbi:MAG: hypothetical protein WEA04_04745 [Candidatus Andersenbacteria bacterium]
MLGKRYRERSTFSNSWLLLPGALMMNKIAGVILVFATACQWFGLWQLMRDQQLVMQPVQPLPSLVLILFTIALSGSLVSLYLFHASARRMSRSKEAWHQPPEQCGIFPPFPENEVAMTVEVGDSEHRLRVDAPLLDPRSVMWMPESGSPDHELN